MSQADGAIKSGHLRWSRTIEYGVLAACIAVLTLLQWSLPAPLRERTALAVYVPGLAILSWLSPLRAALSAALLSWTSAACLLLFSATATSTGPISLALLVASSGLLLGLAQLARNKSASPAVERDEGPAERARLAAIVNSSDDAIVSKNLDGIVQSWNAGAERIFGYRSEEMLGRSITLLIPEERRFEEDHILLRLRKGERVEHFETVRVAKDGTRLDVSLSISPIINQAGEVIGASKIARNVTDRKRSERALAEQQELLRATLSGIADAVITTGSGGQVSYLNLNAERLTGYSLEQAKGKPISEVFRVVHETSGAPIVDPHTRVLRTGGAIEQASNILLVHGGEQRLPIEHAATPILDGEGKVAGAVICFRDITERRRAADAIAEQREWLETTLVSIGDAVIATDIRGRVTFMNPVAEHMTGWHRDEAEGVDCKVVFNIVNEHTRAAVENPVMRVLREGNVVGLANHTVLIGRDGREQPIDDSAAPIRNAEGHIRGVVLVFHDIAERRGAERERQAAERERDALLQSERAARAEAERASRVKDQFLATLSHELRTPLNAIIGWIDLIKRNGSDQATVARGLSVIERNARVQAQLVSDLLDVSRIVAGKMKLELHVLDPATALREALETVRAQAEAKKQRLQVEIAGDLDALVGDPDRLQQVFWNLLTNAIKFTPEGGRIVVKAERAHDGTLISVADDGVGIPAEFLPHLFERFRQADSSTTRQFGGLGLGLTIVRQLVELHGGRISAASEGAGKGAVFTIRLPSASVSPSAPAGAEEGERTSIAGTGRSRFAEQLAGLRVTLVEDDADGRELVTRMLEEAGCEVVAVGSASEALAQLQANAPDLLISDIGLPGEDGYALIERVRAQAGPELAKVPAIALTAFARAEDRARALRAGFQAHLPKPIDPAELLATAAGFANLSPHRRPKGSA